MHAQFSIYDVYAKMYATLQFEMQTLVDNNRIANLQLATKFDDTVKKN